MATEKRIKTRQKYLEKFEELKVRVDKGKRDVYKGYAVTQGKSLNQLIIELLEEKMSNQQ